MSNSATDYFVTATEKALNSSGWTGITAEQIAEAAGVNRVTLYRRGLTTSRLLVAAALAAATEFQQASLAPLTDRGPARERLELLLEALYELADDHLVLLAGLYDGPTAIFHFGGDPAIDDDTITRLEYTEPFERILRDGNVDGTIESKDPGEDAELIFNTAGWTYIHLRRSHGWNETRARKAVSNIAMAYVLPRGTNA